MNRKANVVITFLLALATLGLAADAEAQRRGPRFRQGRAIDGVRFEVHGTAAWYESLGAGMRVEFAIVPDGFIDRVHDELAISLGGEVFFWAWHGGHYGRHGHWDLHHDGVGFMPLGAAQWNFYINERFSLFPELGFAMFIYSHRHDRNDLDDHAHLRGYPLASFGARWHFTDRNALVVRATFPVGFQFGITF